MDNLNINISRALDMYADIRNNLDYAKNELLKVTLAPLTFNEIKIKEAMEAVYKCERAYNDFMHTQVKFGKVKY